jgi:hypothetical protein
MQRRDLSKLALASAIGSFLSPNQGNAQAGGTPPYYAPTPQEVAAHILRYDFPPGDVRRYGAIPYPDPSPATIANELSQQTQCSADAFKRAIDYNAFVYVPPGHYLFTKSVSVTKSGVTIWGAGPSYSAGGVPLGGTSIRLRLSSVPSSNEPGTIERPTIFKWTAPSMAVHIHGIGFFTRTYGSQPSIASRALAFSGLLEGSITGCRFEGGSDAYDDSTGIEFLTSSPYTGAVNISENFFTNLKYGVLMRNTCTTVRISNNEFYGNNPDLSDPSNPNKFSSRFAVFAEQLCSGITLSCNYFEGWQVGFQTFGAAMTQLGNHFEKNYQSWVWSRIPSNLPIYNTSIGDQIMPAVGLDGTAAYPLDDFNGCLVIRTRRFESGSSDNGLKLGNYRLWIDPAGKLRLKNGEPTNATDGTVVGTQT